MELHTSIQSCCVLKGFSKQYTSTNLDLDLGKSDDVFLENWQQLIFQDILSFSFYIRCWFQGIRHCLNVDYNYTKTMNIMTRHSRMSCRLTPVRGARSVPTVTVQCIHYSKYLNNHGMINWTNSVRSVTRHCITIYK